jgi:hypothetical protein
VTDCSIGVQFSGANSLLTNSNFVRPLDGVVLYGANSIVDSITVSGCELGAQISGQGSYFTNSEVNGCVGGVVIQNADSVTVSGNLIHNLYAAPVINGSQINFPDVMGIMVVDSRYYMLSGNQILNLSTSIDQRRGGGTGGLVAGIYIDAASDGIVQSSTMVSLTGKSTAFWFNGGDAQAVYLINSYNVTISNNVIGEVRGGDNYQQNSNDWETFGGNAYGITAMNVSAFILSNQVCLLFFPSLRILFAFLHQTIYYSPCFYIQCTRNLVAYIVKQISTITGGSGGYSQFANTPAATGGIAAAIFGNGVSLNVTSNTLSNVVGGLGGNKTDPEAYTGNGGNAYGLYEISCIGQVNNNNQITGITGGPAGVFTSNLKEASDGKPGQAYPTQLTCFSM